MIVTLDFYNPNNNKEYVADGSYRSMVTAFNGTSKNYKKMKPNKIINLKTIRSNF